MLKKRRKLSRDWNLGKRLLSLWARRKKGPVEYMGRRVGKSIIWKFDFLEWRRGIGALGGGSGRAGHGGCHWGVEWRIVLHHVHVWILL